MSSISARKQTSDKATAWAEQAGVDCGCGEPPAKSENKTGNKGEGAEVPERYSPPDPQRLAKLEEKGWKVWFGETDGDGKKDPLKMSKEFKLKRFASANWFIVKLGIRAHALKHHPTILTTYASVHITLTTHATNSLTRSDLELAEAIEEVYEMHLISLETPSDAVDISEDIRDKKLFEKGFQRRAKEWLESDTSTNETGREG